MYHQYFEEELLELREEVDKHPELKVLLIAQDTDIYMQIAEIAAYCSVLLEGTYTKEDILKICEKLRQELVKKREISIHTGLH